MAKFTGATNCPACGTFNALGGDAGDEYLTGQCGCCNRTLYAPNTSYVAPDAPAPGTDAALVAENESLKAELETLRARIVELTGEPLALPPEPPVGATVESTAVSGEPVPLVDEGEATEDVDDG